MDVFTHFFIPFAVFTLLKRPMHERMAAGLGGYAPDLDVFVAWTDAITPELYFFSHRGLSHSFVGAPLFAVFFLFVLTRGFWARKWPRMSALQWTPTTVAITAVASYTHLLLDFPTIWGIPALYPFSLTRYSLNWFNYSLMPLLAISGFSVYRLARRRFTDRAVVRALALSAIFVVAAGGVRFATHPPVDHGAFTLPGNWEWEWTTFEKEDGAWRATQWSFGEAETSRVYNVTRPADPAGIAALASAESSVHYRGFMLGTWGPVIPVVEADGTGAWNVTFVDLMTRFRIDTGPSWFPGGDWGTLKLTVSGEHVTLRDE